MPQVSQCNTNSSICTQLNGFEHSNLTLMIQFNNHSFDCTQLNSYTILFESIDGTLISTTTTPDQR